MMKPVLDFAKQVVSLANDMQQSKAEIKALEQGQKEIRQELRDLMTVVQRLAFEMQRSHDNAAHEHQRDRDNAAHEREKLVLRLENALLKLEKRPFLCGSMTKKQSRASRLSRFCAAP